MRLPRVMRWSPCGNCGWKDHTLGVWREACLTEYRSPGFGGDCFEHRVDVPRHLDVAPFAEQAAVRPDQERAAHDSHVAPAIKNLFLDHIESAAPGLVDIGDEFEWQVVLGDEAVVRF